MLYLMLYGGAATLAVIACLFLLFRQGNAFAPAVTPPLRLRRTAAAFMASVAASHAWWVVLGSYWLTDDRTLQQLARESGFRSYSTFSAAFKTHRGMTVAAWMRQQDNDGESPSCNLANSNSD